MKFYEINITPTSPFGTLLKGDTIFGHFCWQAAHDPDLLAGGLDTRIQHYTESPFAVFSSAFPKIENGSVRYFLPRPEAVMMDRNLIGATTRKTRLLEGKKLKKKRWMALERIDVIEPSAVEFLTAKELVSRIGGKGVHGVGTNDAVYAMEQAHNTIDRRTGTTGTGMFAPYSTENQFYLPGIGLAVFALLDEEITDIQKICKGLKRIGRWGFGRDASTGMGRFYVNGHTEHPLPRLEGANACYTLAPAVPQKDTFSHSFYMPFIRFGKHGDRLATGKAPYKRPVVMADEGAVFIPAAANAFTTPWLGIGITGVSCADSRTVAQGYAPWLPIKMEV
ncbi:MAG: hypothetical protein CSA23_00155 [Deltaproteobacteria bacterium]|nr:MAG: hypothetical protein CSA23_00155 [Deltaproteobacteria bacterium]